MSAVYTKKSIGDFGEKIACDILKKNGFTILNTNYRKRMGEIDIIARFGKTIHFVEVKTRTSGSYKYGSPNEAVSILKQKKIIKTALSYLFENKKDFTDVDWKIDVVVVIIDKRKKTAKIKYIENAVENCL